MKLVLFLCCLVFKNTLLFFILTLFILHMYTFWELVRVSIALLGNTTFRSPGFHLWPMLLTCLLHYQCIAM